MSTPAISSSTSAPVSPGPAPGASPANSALASQSMFLQLLIAQLKNQDPQNPADGTQFLTQLAQFTTLEQQTQATTDLHSILGLLQQGAGVPGPSSPGSASTTNTKTAGA